MIQIWSRVLLFCGLISFSCSNAVATHTIPSKTLGNMTFDLTYSGDISMLPKGLRQYDGKLQILPPFGLTKPLLINLDLQSITLADLADTINRMTNNQVNLVYNTHQDSLRLSYSGNLDVARDTIAESLKWQHGGAPKPVLSADGVVRFPYGEYQPVVTCQPLNLCDIELQAGEDIQGIVIGDSQRWNEGDQGIPVVYSGASTTLIPHLVLKPNQGGLETTLMVTTSKRTYMFKLKSSSSAYVARVGFYYPGEMIQKNEDKKALMRQDRNATTAVAINPELKMPLIDLTKINYKYTIKGDDYPWRPTQIFDDGTSVYIQMPHSISSRDLPGVCVLVEGGNDTQCEMVNFRYTDHFYVIDKLFNKAKLMNGFGDNVQTLTIQHTDEPNFWSWFLSGK